MLHTWLAMAQLAGTALAFLLPLAASIALIVGIRRWRPGEPASAAASVGPPATAVLLAMAVAALPVVFRLLLTGREAMGVGTLREAVAQGLMMLAAACVTGAFTGAVAYAAAAAGFALSARARAEAPWLLRSLAVSGGAVVLFISLAIPAMVLLLRGFGGGLPD